jgi:hypothetical protein
MAETIGLKSGSRIILTPGDGPWFDGKEHLAPGACGWQLVDKGGGVRGSGICASRNEAVNEATRLDETPVSK